MLPPSITKRILDVLRWANLLPKSGHWDAAEAKLAFQAGRNLNEYRLSRCLTRNPDQKSTLVYLAESPALPQCIVKVLLPGADPKSSIRHNSELEVLSSISHARIPKILDRGTTADGTSYFVTEHVTASTLLEVSQTSEKWPLPDRLATLQTLAELLAFVHDSGFVHNDLSPENVLVQDATRCHLIDFGIATEIDAPCSSREMITGSPAVISPEAIRREPTTPRSDIYSLGCLGFLILNQQLPFPGQTPIEICWKHLNAEPEPRDPGTERSSKDQGDSTALEEARVLVQECLHKASSDRPESATAVANRLQAIQSRFKQ